MLIAEFGGLTVGNPMGIHCAFILADFFVLLWSRIYSELSKRQKGNCYLPNSLLWLSNILTMYYNWITYISVSICILSIQINFERTKTRRTASYLDLCLDTDTDGRLNINIYENHDEFNFQLINFQFVSSNSLLRRMVFMYLNWYLMVVYVCQRFAILYQ